MVGSDGVTRYVQMYPKRDPDKSSWTTAHTQGAGCFREVCDIVRVGGGGDGELLFRLQGV